jgi:preprotein translocase subunit SecG
MYTLVIIVHVLVCVFLIIVVLLQSGKAADLAGAFGGMGSQTAFGPRGSATLLSKATTASAVLFMITSMVLSIMATRLSGGDVGKTVLDQSPATQTAPGKPAVPAPAVPTPAPVQVPTGPPSVTLTPEGGGPSRTIPLNIPKNTPPGRPIRVPPARSTAPPAQK